jgi:hypothetical protein
VENAVEVMECCVQTRGERVKVWEEWRRMDDANDGGDDKVQVLMQWPTVPVNPGNGQEHQVPGNGHDFHFYEKRFVFHCHVMDHEDFDMMGQVRVDD